ncbi:hypothetical protein BH11PLA2_BH11PLA2_29810 [soil metagenome]
MTTPESITVSLDWAKKLKDAGWPQENGLHYWHGWEGDKNTFLRATDGRVGTINAFHQMFAAPTAEEILRRLPEYLTDGELRYYLNLFPAWVIRYSYPDDEMGSIIKCHNRDSSLANAAAAMWCNLAEQKLLLAA